MKENYNDFLLEEQRKVQEYEGKIPNKNFSWECPHCMNLVHQQYKTYKYICDVCGDVFIENK